MITKLINMTEPGDSMDACLMEELFDRLVHERAREGKSATADAPFFEKPLPKNITAIVVEYCFRPLGVVMNAHTTWSQGWGQKCKCCMEEIGEYDYFCEVYSPKKGKSQYEIAYDSHVKKYHGMDCVWQGDMGTSMTCCLHGDTIHYDPAEGDVYVCQSCMDWTRNVSSAWWGPVEIRGEDLYGSRITCRRRRRRLNPRRRIEHRNAMSCPVTKLLRALKSTRRMT